MAARSALLVALAVIVACGDYDVSYGTAANPGLDCSVPGACATLELPEPETLRVGALSTEDYEACGCSPGNLRFTNDQASAFVDAAAKRGWERGFHHEDAAAIADGLVEDSEPYGGQDDHYADDVDMLLVSGHGGSFPTYFAYLCRQPPAQRCFAASSQMVLGEVPGQPYFAEAAATPGRLRFLILATCDSVNRTLAPYTWGPVFVRGRALQAVLGYTGDSTDSWTTSEAGKDFARKAITARWTVMQAWLWATDDWLIDDSAALIVAGRDAADARRRLSEMRLDTPPSGEPPFGLAWAYVRR